MGDNNLIVLGILFLSCGYVSAQLANDTSPMDDTLQSSAHPKCVVLLPNNSFAPAVGCTNGRRMSGCCVDRINCGFNTTHIDLAMYGPPGYHSPCKTEYVCCPLQYALPFTVSNNSTDGDESDEDMAKEFGDDITDADV